MRGAGGAGAGPGGIGPALTVPAGALSAALARGQFAVTVERITPPAAEPLAAALPPILDLAARVGADARLHAVALTDRVGGDQDHDVVEVAARVAEAGGKIPLVHLAGKARERAQVRETLRRARARGLDALLVMTGDHVPRPAGAPETPYTDALDMIVEARAVDPAALVLATVSPYKYVEEDAVPQYLRMAAKERAGAAGFVTQVGWDMLKLVELAAWRRARGLTAPVMATVMALTPGRVRWLAQQALPGIAVPHGLAALAEEEGRAGTAGAARGWRRLALQIVGLRRLGLAGCQLAGVHGRERLEALLGDVAELDRQLPTTAAWWEAWWEGLRGAGGVVAAAAPRPAYLFHELSEPGGWAVPLDRLTPVEALDRLPDADAAACPKALAHGPCGGATDGRCEVGDRECVHSVAYRATRATLATRPLGPGGSRPG